MLALLCGVHPSRGANQYRDQYTKPEQMLHGSVGPKLHQRRHPDGAPQRHQAR